MNPNQFEAVLFDCDGVLVDSEIIATRALHRSLTNIGWSITEAEVARTFTGHSWPTCVAIIEERTGQPVTDAFLADNERFFNSVMEKELATMPGIESALESLNVPFAVVTNARARELNKKLEVTGLERYFSHRHRFDAETLGVAKPDPAIYRHSADAIGVDVTRCLIIEDSLPGLTAAHGTGATVWAYRPHADEKALLDLSIDRIIQDWGEFADSADRTDQKRKTRSTTP